MFRRLMLIRAMPTLLVAALAVVCLTPTRAQRLRQPVANVLDFSGQVSVKNSDGGMETPVSMGLVVRQTQLIVTGKDGWAKFQYTDGSTFEVFPNSKVVFQEHPADFQHLLNVWIGHIKVWIQHAPGVPNYKNVQTPTAVISVRGTIFSVDVQNEDTTVVAVEEGLVDVKNTTAINGTIPRLSAGQSITVIRGVPLAFNRNNMNNQVWGRILRAAEDTVYQVIWQRRAGGGFPGGPVGTTGGAQGDKGKTTGGTGGTTPTAPSAPTPPAAPPAPGGGH